MSKYHVTLVAELSARGEHEAVAAIEQEESLVEQKQREIDALSAKLAESDAALAESRENDMESMRQCHELAAQVEMMREALTAIADENSDDAAFTNWTSLHIAYEQIARRALSVTPSAALLEVKARAREEGRKEAVPSAENALRLTMAFGDVRWSHLISLNQLSADARGAGRLVGDTVTQAYEILAPKQGEEK